MKNPFQTLVLLTLTTLSTQAQGTITFWNSGIDSPSGGTTYDAPISAGYQWTGPLTLASGPDYTVGLFVGAGDAGTLVPGSQSTFLTGGGAGFFNPIFDLPIPGFAPGTTPTLTVRGWVTSFGSFAAARASGFSGESLSFTSKPLGGPNANPPPPSFFTPTMTGFTGLIIVPEPSTIALSVMGVSSLLLLQRRK
jgi:hypothetical protein